MSVHMSYELVPEASPTRKENADEVSFLTALRDHGFPMPEVNFAFHPERKYRLHYAWPAFRVAVIRMDAVHGKKCQCCGKPMGAGYPTLRQMQDLEQKRNAATALAWHTLRYRTDEMALRSTLKEIRTVLEMRGAELDPNAKISLDDR